MEIKDVDMFELENQRSEAIKKTGKYIELNIIIGAENDTSSDGSVGKYPVITSVHSISFSLNCFAGVPVVAQWLMNPTRNHEVAGSVPALAQWVNDPALP